MPLSAQKGARSRLADVLADIKNSRAEDDFEFNNQDVAPTPAKRRVAVNYVALSGHTPRQSRSNTSSSSQFNNLEPKTTPAQAPLTTPKTRTYVLKLFDRSVDLAPFSVTHDVDNDSSPNEVPLYPICRAWVQVHKPTNQQNIDHNNHDQQRQQQQNNNHKLQHKSPAKQACAKIEKVNGNSPIDSSPQESPSEVAAVEVYTLPPPTPKSSIIERFKIDVDHNDTDIRIPQSVRHFKPTDNLKEALDKSINSMNHRECLQLNKERWKRVKRDWSHARGIYESRYVDSFKVINEMLNK